MIGNVQFDDLDARLVTCTSNCGRRTSRRKTIERVGRVMGVAINAAIRRGLYRGANPFMQVEKPGT